MNDLLVNHYEELYHYGVKGMKWGVRKTNTKSTNTNKAHRKAATEFKTNQKIARNLFLKDPTNKRLRERLRKSDSKLKKHVEEYISTLSETKMSDIIKYDTEHAKRYVDARVFDSNITYDHMIYLD